MVTTAVSAQDVGRRLAELKLISRDDWARLQPQFGHLDGDELLRQLENRGTLTGYQIDKFRKGDTNGYLLGRFRIMYRISAGTFARVYRGIDTKTNEMVAVKVLRGRHTESPESVKQFHREAKLMQGLQHSNIVRVLEVAAEASTKQHYIAMEFIDGGNLRELLRIRGKVSPAETVRLGAEMLDGLAAAHEKGVTHRDIKPTNILFTTAGQIKWVDFGLAGLTEAPATTAMKLDEQQQHTVDYVGLERATGATRGDLRSDLFFLGTVLYHMLTGEPAMPETRDRGERKSASRFRAIKPLAENREVPGELAAVVDKLLAFMPDDRYQTALAALADLRRAGASLAREESLGAAPRNAALEGFPPGPPRLLVAHAKVRLHDEIKDKLERCGYAVVCNADLGRAMMLHELKPFHGVVIDLASFGEAGVKAYAKAKQKAATQKRNLAGVLLATQPEHAMWASRLDADRTTVLQGEPVTMTQLRRALAGQLPGLDAAAERA